MRKKKYYHKRLEAKLKAKKEDKIIEEKKLKQQEQERKEQEEKQIGEELKKVQFQEVEKRLDDNGSQYKYSLLFLPIIAIFLVASMLKMFKSLMKL